MCVGQRMRIPFMRLDRQFEAIRDELVPDVLRVLESGHVLQSPEVEDLEQRLAALHGCAHCVTVNSGTDALIFAIMALNLREGSRIAVPAMTFVASASAILHARCVPVFVDVDPETMLMDEAQVIDLIHGKEVEAVLAVHLYGQLMPLDGIAAEAARYGIAIIEDAAQAIGATRNGEPAGRWGRVSCLSFDPTKVLGAYGSGGAALTNDADIARRVRRLRYHGHSGNQTYEMPGYNSQMDSIQAAILCAKMDFLESWQTRRSEIAARIRNGLAGLNSIRPLKTLPGNLHNYHKFVLHAEDRPRLVDRLKQHGVDTKVQYPIPLHRQPCFAGLSRPRALPKVEQAAQSILSLPMYAELSDEETDYMVETIVNICR